MQNESQSFDWQGALLQTYHDLSRQIFENLPQVIGAILLLVVGWLVATILRALARKLLRGLNALFERIARQRGLDKVNIRDYSGFGGSFVFWSVMLFFIASSANLLDWKVFSTVTQALLRYLPELITGLVIIFVGFALASFVRSLVSSAAVSAGFEKSDLLGRISQFALTLTALVIGLEHLGVNVTFITTVLIVSGAVLLAGACLAFALGARQFVANIIGAQISRKHCFVGQKIKLGGIEGSILEISATAIVVDTAKGKAAIPAKLVNEAILETLAEEPEPSAGIMSNIFGRKGGEREST